MKKILLPIFLAFASVSVAQNLTDALRYSIEDQKGTARFRSMGGAFGAIGGDFSAININPAGGAVFSSSEVGFSFGDQLQKSDVTFFGNLKKDLKEADFAFNQFGVVFNLPTSNEKGWRKVNLAFNYEQMRNFDNQSIKFSGLNNDTNLGDYFLSFASYNGGIQQQDLMLTNYENKIAIGSFDLSYLYGEELRKAKAPNIFRKALLGYTVGLINPKSGIRELNENMTDEQANAVLQEKEYYNNVAMPTLQQYEIETSGGVQKYNFNISSQYDDVYIGLNLNTHIVDYNQRRTLLETYRGATDIKSAFYREDLHTTGQGFSLQLGAIVKVTQELRLGASYASPTWYTLHDETEEYLSVESVTEGTFFANPRTTVVYEEYKFRSPSAWTASAAYVFGKWGLIDIDYTYKGYANTYFRSSLHKVENDIITEQLQDTNALRVGGELRYKGASMRAGYRWEQSPYRKKYNTAMGNRSGFAFGLGYAFSGIRLDFAYDISNQNTAYVPYETVLNTPALIKGSQRNLLFTIGIKLF